VRVGYTVQHKQKRWFIAPRKLGQKIILRPLATFIHLGNNTLVNSSHALIKLPAVDNSPPNTELIQSLGDGLYPPILPAGLNPDLLQPSRLAFENGFNRMPAKYKFSGH
jgi:hypothetical protein